jgi:hypothetical protein
MGYHCTVKRLIRTVYFYGKCRMVALTPIVYVILNIAQLQGGQSSCCGGIQYIIQYHCFFAVYDHRVLDFTEEENGYKNIFSTLIKTTMLTHQPIQILQTREKLTKLPPAAGCEKKKPSIVMKTTFAETSKQSQTNLPVESPAPSTSASCLIRYSFVLAHRYVSINVIAHNPNSVHPSASTVRDCRHLNSIAYQDLRIQSNVTETSHL